MNFTTLKSKLEGLFHNNRDFSHNFYIAAIGAFGPLLIALVGGVYTGLNWYLQNKQIEQSKSQAKIDRDNKMATQMLANRETEETDFRQTMFVPLTERILNEKVPLYERMETFELFENNFSDLFNCRSFFDVLYTDALKQTKSKNPYLCGEAYDAIDKLKSIGRRVIEWQECLIGGCRKKESIIQGIRYTVSIDSCPNPSDEIISLYVDAIKSDHIEVHMSISYLDTVNGVAIRQPVEVNQGYRFWVTYYDAPLTDNTLVPDGDRIALVLDDLRPLKNAKLQDPHRDFGLDTAIISVIHFPADFVTIGYRPTMSRINDLIVNGNK